MVKEIKRIDKSWIVAKWAAILSFLFTLFSILLSNYFQKNIYNINPKIISILTFFLSDKIIVYYTNFSIRFSELFSFLKLDDINVPEFLIPIFFGVIMILEELGVKEKSFLNSSISKLFSTLKKQQHGTLNLYQLYIKIKILVLLTIIIFSISWYFGDIPSQICSSISLLVLYSSAYIYSYYFHKTYEKCHLKETRGNK